MGVLREERTWAVVGSSSCEWKALRSLGVVVVYRLALIDRAATLASGSWRHAARVAAAARLLLCASHQLMSVPRVPFIRRRGRDSILPGQAFFVLLYEAIPSGHYHKPNDSKMCRRGSENYGNAGADLAIQRPPASIVRCAQGGAENV